MSKYHGMPPQEHFRFMFKANIELTGRVRTNIQDIAPLSYSDPIPLDMPYEVEREMSITMGEHDYNNFMKSYGKYLELTYAIEQDSIAKDMFHKLLMYIALKQ